MKLHILSDLHLSLGAMAQPTTDADVVVLAGDIARPREAAAWAQGFGKPVVYVLGNHEFYGRSLDGARAELKGLCQGTAVHVLDDEELILGGVRFLGATLWTGFELFGPGENQAAAMAAAQRSACCAISASCAPTGRAPSSRRRMRPGCSSGTPRGSTSGLPRPMAARRWSSPTMPRRRRGAG